MVETVVPELVEGSKPLFMKKVIGELEYIMEDWKEYKLSDIMNLIGGGTPKTSVPEYWNGDIPWISVKDFNGERRFVGITEKTITQAGLDNSSTKILSKGDVIISARGTVGELAIIPSDMAFNQSCYGLRAKEFVDPTFLYYLLKQSVAVLKHNTHGSVFDTITKETFEGININLPPLPTQQKIAQILSSLDDKIELNNKINANLEQQAQALFKSWFVDFEPFGGEMPAGWKVGTLSDVADYYNGYAFSSKELLDEPNDDCFDVFKQGHIVKGGGFNADGTKSWFPKAKCDKLQNFILKKGDILMAMTDMKGNVAILGNTAIMPIDDKYIVNQRVGLLRAKKELEVDYPYLYLLTNEHDFLMDLRSRANSGVQVNLSSTAIKESQINVATNEDYKKFNNLVLPLFEKILANQLENTKLSNLRDTLLPKLMNGEIKIE